MYRSRARFKRAMLPHWDAAYNLTRWLIGSPTDAEDVAHDASLRALAVFDSFHGEDGREWLLAIVRNTCYDWLRKNRRHFELHSMPEELETGADPRTDPERVQLGIADQEAVRRGLEALPAEYREVLVFRELEGMSYKQISQVANIPIGAAMSRLARARKRLETELAARAGKGDELGGPGA